MDTHLAAVLVNSGPRPPPPPRLLVFSSLFPHATQPGSGLFVRERMFRVGRILPLWVVSPRPASPLDSLVRRHYPHYRPPAPSTEIQAGFTVRFPRFPSLPILGRGADGIMMAFGALPLLYRRRETFDVIDAHFGYPDGYAATRLGRWLGKPVTVTLRGTEVPHSRDPTKRQRLIRTCTDAAHLFAVSESLARLAAELGAAAEKIQVVGNGVDPQRFRPLERAAMRARFGLPIDAQVLISVGGLVERKGFHRVIEVLPELVRDHPRLHYLIVGGAGAEGDFAATLQARVATRNLGARVHFLGHLPPERLAEPLSAADVFVLASSNEGWANCFLEAMACGLPVVTTDVGGNREVVSDATLGTMVPFGDPRALADALSAALRRRWDSSTLRAHAQAHTWDQRVATLVQTFRRIDTATRTPAQ